MYHLFTLIFLEGGSSFLWCIPMIPTDMPFEFKRFGCDSHLQWPSTKHKDNRYTSVAKFGKSFMLYTWTPLCDLPTHMKTFWFICIPTRHKNKIYHISKSDSINRTETNTFCLWVTLQCMSCTNDINQSTLDSSNFL